MNTETMKRGALAGMAGGIVMAMWSMLALWASGTGFWSPLNLIAHTLWRGAPLDQTFSAGALVLGLVVHMMMSMMLGVAIAIILTQVSILAQVSALRRTLAVRLVTGMGIGLMVWAVMQYGVWPVVDAQAAPEFTPWIFALGHLMFGLATAFALTHNTTVSDERAKHAAST